MTAQTPKIALVADSDAISRVLLRNFLKTLGFQIVEAFDGRQLEEFFKLHQQQVSLVYLDVHMPSGDGFQALKNIRFACPEIPMFVVSARSDRESLKKCMQVGIDGFYAKPLDLQRVDAALHTRFSDLLKTAWENRPRNSSKKKSSSEEKSRLAAEGKRLNFDTKKEVESILALNRKLSPNLPKLTTQQMEAFPVHQKIISRSGTYRAMRYAMVRGNIESVAMCLKSLPSQYQFKGALDCRDSRVYIPIIGELLCESWNDYAPEVLQECVDTAFYDLRKTAGHLEMSFDYELRIQRGRNRALFIAAPFMVEFAIKPASYGESGSFEFQIDRFKTEEKIAS